jgi:hypothetical protein
MRAVAAAAAAAAAHLQGSLERTHGCAIRAQRLLEPVEALVGLIVSLLDALLLLPQDRAQLGLHLLVRRALLVLRAAQRDGELRALLVQLRPQGGGSALGRRLGALHQLALQPRLRLAHQRVRHLATPHL